MSNDQVKVLTRVPSSLKNKQNQTQKLQQQSAPDRSLIDMSGIHSARAARIKSARESNERLIKEATEEVNRLAGEDRLTIPEGIFVKYFLPMFAGEQGMYPPNAPEEWLKISRGGMSPVTIISESGQDVIDVPPRYSRALINVRKTRDRLSTFEALETFKDLAVSSPVRAQNYFDRVIQPPTADMTERQKYAAQWQESMDKVLTHYGKKTGVSNNNSGTTGNNKDVPLVYDDSDML